MVNEMTENNLDSTLGGLCRSLGEANERWNRHSQLTHIVMASALLGLLAYNVFDFSEYGIQHSILLTIAILAPSIMLHELMHVLAARDVGYHGSRYIAFIPFLLLSCLIVLIFRAPLLLLPGFASVSMPARDTRRYPFIWYLHDKIPIKLNIQNQGELWAFVALAGPVANLLIYFFALPFVLFLPDGLLKMMFSLLVVVNINLAVFNMLPLPIFDGQKTFVGNKVWFAEMWLAIGISIFIGLLLLGALGVRLIL
jgi:Zn-dependent protease